MILWVKDDRSSAWRPMPLTVPLTIGPATIVPFVEHRVARAALVTAAAANLTVNGYAPLGVTVLEEKADIAADGVRLLFSHYTPAEPAPLPAAHAGERCSRCLGTLAAGELAVRCPACAAFAHESPRLPCHSYDPHTGCCGRARAELAWTPADGEEEPDAAA